MVQPMQNLPWEELAEQGYTPLLLIRHGRTAANAQKRFVGRQDVPLDQEGRAQAARLGERLRALPRSALYSSPLSRAVETARALGEPGTLPDLMELDQGEWEGRLGHEVMREYPDFFAQWVQDPSSLRVPGGETLAECQARAVAAVEALARRHGPGAPVVVVTHQMVLHTLVLHAQGRSLRELRSLKQGNTALNLLGWRADGWAVGVLNDTEHLVVP